MNERIEEQSAKRGLVESHPEPRGIVINHDDRSDMDIIGGRESPLIVAHNFSGPPEQQMALEMAATGPDSLAGGEMIGQMVEIEFWYAHRVTIEGKDGELVDCARTVLITKEGVAIRFVSQGVYDALRLLVKYYGRKKFDPPLKMVIKSVKCGAKNHMLTLSPFKG